MCNFPSWKESGNEIAYLTDEEAKEHFLDAYNAIGHSAIERVFPKTRGWENKEMVRGDCVPKEFVKAIHGGKCKWMMSANKYKKLHFNSEGQLHSINDEPAVEYVDGDKEWYKNGQRHREGNPAIEYANGGKYWYVNGHLHCIDGPAIEYADGGKYWYINDQLHREDGPAVERPNGKYWYIKGKLHRIDGPAIEYVDGYKEWYENGNFIKLEVSE